MDQKLEEGWIRNQEKDGLETRRSGLKTRRRMDQKLGEGWIRNQEKDGLETRRRMDDEGVRDG